MEIDKFYKYSEVKKDKATIMFGWADANSLPDVDYIVSYHSRSKFASEEEALASRREGSSAATVADYRKFFEKLVGSTPEWFYDRWDGKEKDLALYWKSTFPKATDGKQHLFMLKLARLLVTGKKFVMYSRGFKMVKADERQDAQTEV